MAWWQQPNWVTEKCGHVQHIPIKIPVARGESDGVHLQEPPQPRRIDPIAVVVEPDFVDPLPPGEQETITKRGMRNGVSGGIENRGLAVGVVLVPLEGGTRFVGERDRGAEGVVVVVDDAGRIALADDLINRSEAIGVTSFDLSI